ncbi:hypothetical protein NL676_028788 [Syzygium grande]|nr:hypothetical protein NL676_028788 [Syzygium grande]
MGYLLDNAPKGLQGLQLFLTNFSDALEIGLQDSRRERVGQQNSRRRRVGEEQRSGGRPLASGAAAAAAGLRGVATNLATREGS